ncbi:MAG: DinB family protein [Bacillota bacterium]|nr:MAG: hypothetical protein DIU70_05355 [Bacillota bacterium]
MERVPVYLEVGLHAYALCHCLRYPGAGFKAPTSAAALALAPRFVREEREWLRRMGEPVPEGPVEIEAPEQVVLDVPVHEGDTEAIFGPELEPLTRPDLEWYLRYLRHSREDLWDLARSLPDGILRSQVQAGRRTPMEILHHIADAEVFYLVRLEPETADLRGIWERSIHRHRPPLERLQRVREHLLERLSRLTEEDCRRVARHDPHGEVWTARKVLRRAIWHERYHTRQLERFLTL